MRALQPGVRPLDSRAAAEHNPAYSGNLSVRPASERPIAHLREACMSISERSKRQLDSLEPVVGNGLLHRRALLGRGLALAGSVATGTGTSLTSAPAEFFLLESCDHTDLPSIPTRALPI